MNIFAKKTKTEIKVTVSHKFLVELTGDEIEALKKLIGKHSWNSLDEHGLDEQEIERVLTLYDELKAL